MIAEIAQPDRAAVVGCDRGGSPVRRGCRPGPSTPGSVRCGFGLASSAPGSVSIRPVRWAQAVNTRAAVARRAIVLRALPRLCCLASQERSTADVEPVQLRIVTKPNQMVEQVRDVTEVGSDRMFAEVSFRRQMPFVVSQ